MTINFIRSFYWLIGIQSIDLSEVFCSKIRDYTMVFNATFNNIAVTTWWSVLLMEDIGVPGENHWPAKGHRQNLSDNVVSSTNRLSVIRTHNFNDDMHWLHR
jgi:hypothetical protein